MMRKNGHELLLLLGIHLDQLSHQVSTKSPTLLRSTFTSRDSHQEK